MKYTMLSLGLFLLCQSLQAQDYGLYWKYKDYDGAISFAVPGFLMEMGSLFIDEKEDRAMVRKVNKVRVMVFPDHQNPVTDRDMRRFVRKAKRRHLEDMVMVREGKTHVHVMAKEGRKGIRKIVVLVNTPEEFALVSIKGNLQWNDINKIIDKYGKDVRKKGKKKVVPEVIDVPVKRV